MPAPAPQVTIADGESLSSASYIGHGVLTGIVIPASWTTATITFQGSADGTNFYDIYDYQGAEVEIQAGSSRLVTIDDFKGTMGIKIRSGTSGSPVTQSGDITLTLIVQKLPIP